ncbi:MAG: c-type cytochrome [Sulfuricurvum sp.]
MFDYPIFEMPVIGQRMLMAINAIIHIYVSHGGAVGGSVVLALLAIWAHKRGDLAAYKMTFKILMVFFIISTSVGALTGIGMWIHANILSPNAIGGLIRVFFWKWFTEWIVFNFEVVLLLMWFMTWKKNEATLEGRAKSNRLGVYYAIASWLTMVIITAILAFMLTPNFDGQPWVDPEVFPGKVDYNNALFNPTWGPSLAFRTFSAIAFAASLAIMWTWIIGTFSSNQEDKDAKPRIIKFLATIMVITVPLSVIFGYWYLSIIPESALSMIPTAMMTREFEDKFSTMYMIVIGIGVVVLLSTLIAYFAPKRMPYIAASAMVIAFLVFWGYEERVREFIRKPYIIYNYMYSNGIRPTDVPYLNKVGVLKHATFIEDENKILAPNGSNQIAVGHSIYLIECRICHTDNGINGLKSLTKGWSQQAIEARLNNLPGGGTPYMPPFVGTQEEKKALAAYIRSLNVQGELK